jgi:hypothetical protein
MKTKTKLILLGVVFAAAFAVAAIPSKESKEVKTSETEKTERSVDYKYSLSVFELF